jgi:hypothetical protein
MSPPVMPSRPLANRRPGVDAASCRAKVIVMTAKSSLFDDYCCDTANAMKHRGVSF